MIDPLFHEGWITFNERHWSVRAERLELGPKSGTAWRLQAVLYHSKQGGLVTPPRNAYLPAAIETAGSRPAIVSARRREAISALADLVSVRGVTHSLTLSSAVDDVRPFHWHGFQVEPRYTYHVDLPLSQDDFDPKVGNKIRKAEKSGYCCEVTVDFDRVQECLRGPEDRKRFAHKVDTHALQELQRLMGPDAFMAVLCRSSYGEAIGTRLHMFSGAGIAHDWSAGVKTEGLKSGVNNLLCDFSFRTLANRGCTVFDFCGANIPSVAVAKEAWGGRLVPYYTIRPKSFRNVLFTGYQWLKAFKRPPDR